MTLTSVGEVVGYDLVDQVATSIKEEIKKNGGRPENRKVRKRARSIVSDAGYPADDYLDAA